jgi:hypothetical protein
MHRSPYTSLDEVLEQLGYVYAAPPAAAPAEVEPVAWITECHEVDAHGKPIAEREIDYHQSAIDLLPIGTKLYAAPPAAAPTEPTDSQREAWQPIETCPQDGYFLVHEAGAIRLLMRIDGKWRKTGYPALVTDLYGDVVVGLSAEHVLKPLGYHLEHRDGCCENPTHWAPLPARPSPTTDAARPSEGEKP